MVRTLNYEISGNILKTLEKTFCDIIDHIYVADNLPKRPLVVLFSGYLMKTRKAGSAPLSADNVDLHELLKRLPLIAFSFGSRECH